MTRLLPACLGALCIGACDAKLASAMLRAGGGCDWVREALGPGMGFAVGWIGPRFSRG